jgi:alkylhydroperoxidase/carboxymuconolactone decarboxylase family protein YurZ
VTPGGANDAGDPKDASRRELTTDADRRARGIAAFASQFGVEESDLVDHMKKKFGAQMTEEAIQSAGGGAWEENELSLRDRSIAVVAALVAQGGVEARLGGHIRWAIEHGVSAVQIESLITLLAVYVGYPKAAVAMGVAREQLASMGLLDE